jgi:hypothetical protein
MDPKDKYQKVIDGEASEVEVGVKAAIVANIGAEEILKTQ